MHQITKIVFLVALATVSCGVLPAPRVLEGPSSKTTVIGPDGSQISAFAPGGKIVLDENPGPVLQGAPEVVAVAGVAQPPVEVVEEVTPLVEVVKPIVETVAEDQEAAEISRSSPEVGVTEKDETDPTSAPISTEQPTEGQSESLEIFEKSTESHIEEKVTDNPFSVVPLVREVEPVAVRVVEPQPVVGYLRNAPLYVSEYTEFDGHLPEVILEEEFLGV